MNTNMRIELAEAWLDRARRARMDLFHAASAPARFKPEFAEDAQREVYRASQAALYWQQQAGVR